MTQSRSPSFEIDDDRIGWVTFDDPDRSLNVLTERVMGRFGELLAEARRAAEEGRVLALVVRGKADSFIAGADVDAIAAIEDPTVAEQKIRIGQRMFGDLATLPIPTVAAVHGVCMGGGVEMSLACDYRVLSDGPKTIMSLPEVQLGILPAWGGTTRLPRLVGLQGALDLILTGKRVDARRATRIGLASAVLPAGGFHEAVRGFTLGIARDGKKPAPRRRKLLTRILDETCPGRRIVLTLARRKVMAATGGHYPAPLRILDVLGDHLGSSVEMSLAAEARAGAELVVGPVCKNLIHVFHMREAARKGLGAPAASNAASPAPGPVRMVGVLGAGVMGGGIAQLAAARGIHVYLKDVRHEAVTGGLQHARGLFDKAVVRRRMTKREAAQANERISGGLDPHGLSGADLVVEAIVERMEVKKAVLRETEGLVSTTCVLATNTSSLSVTEMAEGLEHPERFCGMHFFNPVHRMPLVEVIRTPRTSDATIATVYRLAVEWGKVPVVVGDGPGFLVNRILGPYLNEAGHLLQDLGSVGAIDQVARDFGMPMGPLRLIDEVGIDVSSHAGASLHAGLGSRLAPSPALEALAETGRLGRKGGLGFYRYENGVEKGVDPTVYAALGLAAPPSERARSEEVARDIRRRLLVAMVNEAARILDDGIVQTARDVDLAMIMGTGFPPFRGGLLRFADTLHPRGVLDRVRTLQEQHGDRFNPAPLLLRLAEEDRSFYAAFPGPGGDR
jgi:3-hydroxyacyl-CoA dehydrogenase/enoyl-CoA hydratase/3-hydroxybutyryl-CoA epimerase